MLSLRDVCRQAIKALVGANRITTLRRLWTGVPGAAAGRDASEQEVAEFLSFSKNFLNSREQQSLRLALGADSNLPLESGPKASGTSPQDRPTQGSSGGENRLRILIVSGMFPSVDHAGGLRIFDLIQGLSAVSDVTVISPYDPFRDRVLLRELRRLPCVTYHPLSPSQFNGSRLSELLDGERFDVAHVTYPNAAPLIPSLRSSVRRVVFEFMECLTRAEWESIERQFRPHLGTDSAVSPAEAGSMRCSIRAWAEVRSSELAACAEADDLLVVSQPDGEFVRKAFKRDAFCWPTPVSETEVFSRVSPRSQSFGYSEPNRAVFVGFFDSRTNQESVLWYLREVHSRVRERVPDYEVVFVGSGDTRPLEDVASHLGGVGFTGRVVHVPPYIESAALCLSPLVSGAGFRGKLNQYSACGRATVATSLSLSGMAYVDGESIVLADSPDDFANRICELLFDRARLARIAKNAYEVAEAQYRMSARLPALLDFYRGVVDGC